MVDAPNPTERHASLQARIDAARQRLADSQKMEWAEVGNILEGISEELEGAHAHPVEHKHATYDRLDSELDAVHARLDAGRAD